MSSYQRKLFKMDQHMGIAIAGLTADARYLTKFMRTECLNHRYVYEGPMQTQRLVQKIADKSQHHTQFYGRRPYGVGLLVIGYDQTGPHLFETDPSGNYFDFYAQAIGARSQAARTYLEKNYKEFGEQSKDDLIKHALIALRETLGKKSDDNTLTIDNCRVGVVGEDQEFVMLEGDALQAYLDQISDDGNDDDDDDDENNNNNNNNNDEDDGGVKKMDTASDE